MYRTSKRNVKKVIGCSHNCPGKDGEDTMRCPCSKNLEEECNLFVVDSQYDELTTYLIC